MRNVLITGGAGFIGSNLAKYFVKNQYNVQILDNLFRGRIENIESILKDQNNSFYNLDLAINDSIEIVQNILDEFRPDFILHYAAINGTQYFYDLPYEVSVTNSLTTYHLLEGLKLVLEGDSAYRPKFILASTSEAYNEPFNIPTNENDLTYTRITQLRDSYLTAKLMSEFYVKTFAHKYDIPFLIFRIFNVYGPNMIGSKYGQVIPEFIQRIKEGEYPLKVFGNGSHTRCFTYIDDHVDISYRVIISDTVNEIINIGNDDETSIKELAILILDKMGHTPKILYLKERDGDHKRRVPDISKLKSIVGDYKFRSLNSGISKLI